MAPPTETEIRTIISQQGYSPSSVDPLEAYLDSQVKGDAPYVFDAVRTLIKHYLLFPDTSNDVKIAHCLMLALLNYPSTDLLALCYLVPQLFTKEPFSTIRKCGEMLDSCKFSEFWTSFKELQSNDDAAIANMAKTAVPKLQGSILDSLALSYKEAPGTIVSAALGNGPDCIQQASKHPSVEKVSGDAVVFVSTTDNTKRQRVYQEGVTFSTISSLIAKMAQ